VLALTGVALLADTTGLLILSTARLARSECLPLRLSGTAKLIDRAVDISNTARRLRSPAPLLLSHVQADVLVDEPETPAADDRGCLCRRSHRDCS
jgi:hypothetical protein